MVTNYNDHKTVVALLKADQEPEHDNREKVRAAHYFVEKEDGQWDPSVASALGDRPRYTFDLTNPIIDQIAGEMDRADFDIRVRPSGGEATKETARIYDGIIRNIENISGAKHVYQAAGRDMVVSGIGGWEVYTDWVDGDAFDQDLMIKPISDFANRVWFDSGAEEQDMSDAKHVFVLQNILEGEYKDRWPDGSMESIGSDKSYDAYCYKPEFVTVARILYKKKASKTLVLMTNGAVYEKNEDFKKIQDELAEAGVTVKRERERAGFKVCSRLFDGGGFLGEVVETVFKELPIIPTFANYRVSDGKVIYRGVVERLMDAQRSFNCTKSREIEEVALAPRAKYWMTKNQAKDPKVRAKLETLNTNNDPVQLFDNDPELPGPPQMIGGAMVNPGLVTASQSMQQQVALSAGLFSPNQGSVDGPMSGIAIQALQNKGDNGTIKYFTSQEVAICQTARVLIGAIPDVYDSERQVRVLGEDGSDEMVSLNERVFDNESGEIVEINNLSKGQYDVTCDVGPAFQNRQQEAVKAFQELSQVIPGLADITADIQLKNIPSPGMDLAAERVRRQLLQSGAIPQSQMTQEEIAEAEQAQMMAQQQPQQPSPEQMIAEAEIGRVQAETADIMSKSQERSDSIQLKAQQQQLDYQKHQDSMEMQQLTMIAKQQQQSIANQQALIEAQVRGQAQIFETLNTQADTLNKLREAMGVDAVVGPGNTEAYINQAEAITEQQENIYENGGVVDNFVDNQ